MGNWKKKRKEQKISLLHVRQNSSWDSNLKEKQLEEWEGIFFPIQLGVPWGPFNILHFKSEG